MLTNPGLLLRVEGALALLISVCLYAHLHGSWLMFALLFLVPDIFMFGYAVNANVGAAVYNFAHTELIPVLLAVVLYFSLGAVSHAWLTYPLIWLAHIGIDRALGFGLKYPSAFKDTHLQRV